MTMQTFSQEHTGEIQTKSAGALFLDLNEYHVFNNVSVNAGFRSVRIDHVIVSRYGVFVAETKNKDGWIFGKPADSHWTQVLDKKRYSFQNPLKQNHEHTQVLAACLGTNDKEMLSVIVFWGNCEFGTIMPENVLNNNLIGFIKSKQDVILTDSEVGQICRQLQQLRDDAPPLDGWHHPGVLKKRIKHNFSRS
jgi:restriction system protein